MLKFHIPVESIQAHVKIEPPFFHRLEGSPLLQIPVEYILAQSGGLGQQKVVELAERKKEREREGETERE